MKRKKQIWYFCAVVMVILVVCTILSACVERQMTAQVVAVSGEGAAKRVAPDALFFDDYGTHLYEVVEGEGWESGSRIREIPAEEYEVGEKGVSDRNGLNHRYVLRSSKAISDGDLVQVTGRLAENQEYLEVETATGVHRYGIEDIHAFLRQMPLVACCLAILIFLVFLFVRLFRKGVSVRISIMIVLLLLALAGVTAYISLPSSLLPQKNIFELKHYIREFREIISLL